MAAAVAVLLWKIISFVYTTGDMPGSFEVRRESHWRAGDMPGPRRRR